MGKQRGISLREEAHKRSQRMRELRLYGDIGAITTRLREALQSFSRQRRIEGYLAFIRDADAILDSHEAAKAMDAGAQEYYEIMAIQDGGE